MSIQTELDRLAAAKADLAEAITGKGVEVPEDTTLDGYAELVANVPSGAKVATGTVILFTSSLQTYTLDGLDFQPNRVIIQALGESSAPSKTFVLTSADSGIEASMAGLSSPYSAWGYLNESAWYYCSGYTKVGGSNVPTWTFNEDGFTVTVSTMLYIGNDGSYSAYLPRRLIYTALG